MTSKEKISRALNHQSGPVPIDFGSNAVTGMHISTVAAMREHYGLEKIPVKVIEPYQMLGEVDNELKNAMAVDTDGLLTRGTMFGFPLENWKEWTTPWGQDVLVPGDFNIYNEGSDIYIYPKGDTSAPASGHMPEGGYFFDTIIRQEVLDEENLTAEDNLEEFGHLTDEDIEYYKKQKVLIDRSNRGIIASIGGCGLGDIALVPGPMMTHPKGIRDVTEWYISTVLRQDLLHEIFDRQTDIALGNLEQMHKILGDSIHAAFICGTDFGTQDSSFCSTDTFDELYMPYYKKVNNWIHENTNWKTFKHCCGAVENFMSHFIESGFDIINPVQCSAAGMDPKVLKERYGKDLVFWGGGVDTQKTLPFGTPEEVRVEVLERCEIFSKEGGFVFNAIHNVQAKTPIENIVAMIEAVKEFNGE
ncbi:MAG: methyltransferase [Spirochaetaceae bacterium 4572_59]|nr:MAG: methyltransferase [Spirochaetaceae bacterium 4572_59]